MSIDSALLGFEFCFGDLFRNFGLSRLFGELLSLGADSRCSISSPILASRHSCVFVQKLHVHIGNVVLAEEGNQIIVGYADVVFVGDLAAPAINSSCMR